MNTSNAHMDNSSNKVTPLNQMAFYATLDRPNGVCRFYDSKKEFICSMPISVCMGLLAQLELKDLIQVNEQVN